MQSRTYSLFVSAMAARQPVACMYQGYPRVLCPIILGHTNGVEKALTWQFEGTGSRGPVRGEWKCLALADVRDAEMVEGPWLAGGQHGQAQSCVKAVDLDVNPDSPYAPRRRLPHLRIVR